MENYRQIAKEAGVSIESVRELMAHAFAKRVETPYYRTTEGGRKVDVVDVFYAVYADHCRPAVILETGDAIVEAVFDALIH